MSHYLRIAVTGAEGQLGSELCRQLGGCAMGLDVPALDLADGKSVRAALADLRPDALINTAAYTKVDKAEKEIDLCWAINARGVGRLAEVCRELDCPLVQISTDYVFGGDAARRTPYRESDQPGPQGVYARSKLEGERLAAGWAKHFIVRTCGLYGPAAPRSGGNFVATMLRLGRQRGRLRVVADQYCTPTYVPHLARAICFLLDSGAFGLYHVVNAGATTWHDFAAEIFRQAGLAVSLEPIGTAEYGAPAPRPAYSVLDTSKYHSLPGAPPMPAWQEALAEYLPSYSSRSA
jgi:dTDP-4-dehydrorhamnose reductase